MFKKVLVAEDFDTYSIAIAEALKPIAPSVTDHVLYCDEALLRIKSSINDGDQYDLLISDLSFKPDHKTTKVKSGMELVSQVRKIAPDMRVIVYSIEDRMHPIKHLFDELDIDGYVLKGRNNIPELRKAIKLVGEGKRYLSTEIAHYLQDKSLEEIEKYDIELIRLLASGISQADISTKLQQNNITPNSISSVEKRLNRLKLILEANNNVHLIAIAKDLGLI